MKREENKASKNPNFREPIKCRQMKERFRGMFESFKANNWKEIKGLGVKGYQFDVKGKFLMVIFHHMEEKREEEERAKMRKTAKENRNINPNEEVIDRDEDESQELNEHENFSLKKLAEKVNSARDIMLTSGLMGFGQCSKERNNSCMSLEKKRL